MTEPLPLVYTIPTRPRGSYHRAGSIYTTHHGTRTACAKLELDTLTETSEISAVLTHEPCHYCFPLWRGRRQTILNQLAEFSLEEPA